MFTDHNGIKTEMSNRVWRAGTDRKGTPGVPAGLAGIWCLTSVLTRGVCLVCENYLTVRGYGLLYVCCC